uniref:coenzyme Q-binding protein COQ10 homolog B, mitochondrial-like n=1 Tax=Erigeron canadensis TaxID=72917 RepID=UPI001CB8EDD6|nr:coenzyme Q-binding protein COQ10 homolog B, mitochondrial-like [Erigeron canadensis]
MCELMDEWAMLFSTSYMLLNEDMMLIYLVLSVLIILPMSSVVSTSKAARQLFICKNGGRQIIRCLRNDPAPKSYVQSRWFRSIARFEALPPSGELFSGSHEAAPFCLHNTPFGSTVIIQRRGFLGCGDGDQGSKGLAKVHEEKCTMGYSPEQMYAVVAAVDMYQDFLPWCRRSDIVQRHSDGSFDAELEIGFKFLVESYVSHVKLVKPKVIKTTSSQSSLFNHLINVWEFHPGPVPGTCDLHFFVDFKFQSPFYSQMASVFFKEVVSRLVDSFRDRCRLIYGPEVSVIGQRT